MNSKLHTVVTEAPYQSPRTAQKFLLRGKGKKMKNLKFKSALLSSAALIVVAATFTSTGSVAGDGLAAQLAPVISLIDDVVSNKTPPVTASTLPTNTPIKHLV